MIFTIVMAVLIAKSEIIIKSSLGNDVAIVVVIAAIEWV